jgi:hypothetical protein
MIQIGIDIAVKGIKNSLVVNIFNAFDERVIADGGIFEAKACLIAQLASLNNIPSQLIPQLINNFNTRIIADGGIFEAQNCLLIKLTFLNNIQ